MIIVTTEYTLEAIQLKKFLRELKNLVNFVAAYNTGCNRIDVGFSKEDAVKVILYQEFRSQKQLDKFFNSEQWKKLENLKKDLVFSEKTRFWEKLSIRPMIWD